MFAYTLIIAFYKVLIFENEHYYKLVIKLYPQMDKVN